MKSPSSIPPKPPESIIPDANCAESDEVSTYPDTIIATPTDAANVQLDDEYYLPPSLAGELNAPDILVGQHITVTDLPGKGATLATVKLVSTMPKIIREDILIRWLVEDPNPKDIVYSVAIKTLLQLQKVRADF